MEQVRSLRTDPSSHINCSRVGSDTLSVNCDCESQAKYKTGEKKNMEKMKNFIKNLLVARLCLRSCGIEWIQVEWPGTPCGAN